MNILILSLTPVRADHLSCYGYFRDTTPNLDRFAEEGLLFEQAYSPAGWTLPAHASLLTGRYPSNHGVFSDGTRLRNLPPSLPTLPELLSDQGYHTAGFFNSGILGPRTGLDRGFRELYEIWRLEGSRDAEEGEHRPEPEIGPLRKAINKAPRLKGWAKSLMIRSGLFDLGSTSKGWFTRADITTRRILAWLDAPGRRENPFFLFLHYGDTHYRCYAPFPWTFRYVSRFHPGVDWSKIDVMNHNPFSFMTGQVDATPDDFEVLRALYDAELSYLDANLGRLFAGLRRTGLLDQTLVIVLSHHGTNFGEHGLGSQVASLYEPLVHVPLIIRHPGLVPAGARRPDLIQLTDVLPTVLSLAGRGTDDLQLDGRRLPPFEESPSSNFAVAEWNGDDTWYFLNSYVPEIVRAARHDPARRLGRLEAERFTRSLRMVRAGDYKYIAGSDGRDELYNLAIDPEESQNLSDREPERAWNMADQLRSRLGPTMPGPQDGQDRAAILEGLRDMGYKL